MTAVISHASIVGGHDGRAEIDIEITYDNGGITTISLDEEACIASLDRAGVTSIDELVGKPWSVVLPPLEHRTLEHQDGPHPAADDAKGHHHARPRHP
ncbi:MAG: hypothetical protein ACE37B_22195 [Ilumatobacter sp.]|uniref:hypothetical protein n=1 Tax=Ilumatobacter sp. TaxID=1967498 RepID=UPI00391C5786